VQRFCLTGLTKQKEIKNMIAVLKKTATKDQIESLKGWFENKHHKFGKGDQRRYTRGNTPLLLAADIHYGFQQFGGPTSHVTVSDYVSRIVVDSRRGVSHDGELQPDSPIRRPCFAFRSGKSTATIVGECAVCVPVVLLYAVISSTLDTDFERPSWAR
jgi:hypothetical protein